MNSGLRPHILSNGTKTTAYEHSTQYLMRVQKVAGMTMSPNPRTEKGYCFDGSARLGNKNFTGASIRVATVICGYNEEETEGWTRGEREK